MIALVGAVFVASLLGSFHCAGMCGAFLAFAVAPGPNAPRTNEATLHAAYNLGRLTTYVALGTIAGLVGAALDLGGREFLTVQRLAAVCAGTLMVAFGTMTLLRLRGVKLPRIGAPAALERALTLAHRRAARQSPVVRAALTGLLTTLLPCGWLYAFVITAAGTGSPASGALTMASFWLGTLPAMIALGAGVRRATGALGRRLPALTAWGLVGVGTFTIAQRLALPPMAREAVAGPAASQVERVEALRASEAPCCDGQAR